jgi:murein DD-endopeptidase MepM/ murein hydrolase activator NlpD
MREPVGMLRLFGLAVFLVVLGTPGTVAATSPGAELSWASPLTGPLVVARPFDPPRTRFGPGHRGVDLRSSVGAEVHAPGPGTVRFAGTIAGRGVVSVDSLGFRFSYEPVRPEVRAGQTVTAATVLGTLVAGHPGCATCLHWGVRRGRQYLDPVRPLAAQIRLLPLRRR